LHKNIVFFLIFCRMTGDVRSMSCASVESGMMRLLLMFRSSCTPIEKEKVIKI
jgi:hypothetical protein